MKKRVFFLLVAVLLTTGLLLAGSACEKEEDLTGNNGINNGEEADTEETPGEKSPEVSEEESEEKILQTSLYFAEPEAVETGEEGEYGYVKPVEREFAYTSEKLAAVIKELIRGPLPEEGNLSRTTPETLSVMESEIENGTATVNFCSELITAKDKPAGTLGAAVFTQSLVYTITELEEVDNVMLLVEGEYWDDGHAVWDEPLGRGDL